MMKFLKNYPLAPFLLAVYPIFTLYSRNPGELMPSALIRPSLIAVSTTAILLFIIYMLTKDRYRTIFISAAAMLFLSASGHVYRIIKSDYLPGVGNWFHLLLISLEISLLIFLAQKSVWMRLKPNRWQAQATPYLNLFAALTFILPIYNTSQFWIQAYNDTPQPWTAYVTNIPDSLELQPNPPDIYYIILDGYGQTEMLKNVYGFDNSEFINFLEAQSFFIAAQSRSNYVQTTLSLSSTLNMTYLDFMVELAGRDSYNRLPIYELVQNNHSFRLLREAGYSLVTIESGYTITEIASAEHFFSPFHNNLNGLESYYVSTTALDALIESQNPLGDALFWMIPPAGYRAHGERIVFSLTKLTEISKMTSENPKLVFVHVSGPHPPFVFDSQGNRVEIETPFLSGDGMEFSESSASYQSEYIGQLKYINTLTRSAVEAIITNSATPPIIIIQGDHGPGSLLNRDYLDRSCMYERTSILNAYYFPDKDYRSLYNTITPVNSFRVVFNQFFGQNLPLLPDETYFAPQSRPYQFTQITNQNEKYCP